MKIVLKSLLPWTLSLSLLCVQSSVSAQSTNEPRLASVGAGGVWLGIKPDASVHPKPAPYRTGEMAQRAVATNSWYSSLMYGQWSGVLHAHPLTFKATERGMEMGLPQATTGPISLIKNWAQDSTGTFAVAYPHVADLTVRSADFRPVDARLQNAGDWNITVEMRQDQAYLRSHILHGSPMAYFELNAGRAEIELGKHVAIHDQATEILFGKQVHYLKSRDRVYGVYLPPASKLTSSDNKLTVEFPSSATYFSIGLLTQNNDVNRQAFAKSAFAFIENTEVTWSYDETQSLVTTRYAAKTRLMDGYEAPALIGLYPHHQKALSSPSLTNLGSLPSVRGSIQIAAVSSFETTLRLNGLMPMWPQLSTKEASAELEQLLVGDRRRANSLFAKMGNGTYWTGKALGAIGQLMNIAEQQGDTDSARHLEKTLKKRMQQWFSGEGMSYFAHDPNIGSILGYPEEYSSVSAMNDHHFHYGYWIMAAAHLARRDPKWASDTQWGSLVNLLVRDIATSQRKRKDFPFLRNFDVYEGHSWARGNSEFFGLGNDQESSSEAIHAWAAIAFWGEATQQPALKALGAYLYATEVSSILQYWFNIDGTTFHRDYPKPLASMVFGGGYGYSTWWTEEPRQILGINLLPITPASTYLAKLPKSWVENFNSYAIAERNRFDASGKSDDTPQDIWQDIFASVRALKNPEEAVLQWNPRGSVELGETRSRTYFWLQSIKEMGAPDHSVWANVMTHSFFRDPSSGRKTYLAYNSGSMPLEVRFSDGVSFTVPAKQFKRLTLP